MLRRLVLALLFVVLPYQFSWAAAAPYCAHETEVNAAKHFGHHQHKHQAGDPSVSAGDQGAGGTGEYHADCENCNLGAGATWTGAAHKPGDAQGDTAFEDDSPRFRSHTPRGPERPDITDTTLAARFAGAVAGGGTVRST